MGDIGPTRQCYEVLAMPSETVPAALLTAATPDGAKARREPGGRDAPGEPPPAPDRAEG